MSVPPEDEAAVTSLLAHHGAAPVFISEEDVDGFYSGFSNSALWPLFHGFINRSAFSSATWDAYMKVNALFADEICKRAQPGDIVWVHDYQLTLVPELLRERGVTCPVGFFLHVPFPSSEIYRTLPVRENILHTSLVEKLDKIDATTMDQSERTRALEEVSPGWPNNNTGWGRLWLDHGLYFNEDLGGGGAGRSERPVPGLHGVQENHRLAMEKTG